MTHKTFGNHANISNFLTLMFKGPQSLSDITRETGMAYETVRHLVLHLHKSGCLYISGWRRDMMNRASIAIYQIGIGVDVPKPRARTAVERTRKCQIKKDTATESLCSKAKHSMFKPDAPSTSIQSLISTWGKT